MIHYIETAPEDALLDAAFILKFSIRNGQDEPDIKEKEQALELIQWELASRALEKD